METQKNVTKKGGTMRLGAYPCKIKPDTLAYKIYGEELISERHRHRYEYNNSYKEELEKHGLICSGLSPDGELVEIVELPSNKFFIASQFHPEFKSRPDRPAPLFKEFIKAIVE
jgi:CTP synthase